MKELKLEVGKAGNLKNFYEHPLKIGRNEEGYFIYTKDKKHGPFTNVFLEKGSNEMLIGYNPSQTLLLVMEEKKINIEENALTAPLLEKLNTLLGITKNDAFKDCKLVGKATNYYVYLDANNMFFIAENNNPSSLTESPRFFDYEELVRHYRTNEIYINNPVVAEQARKMKRVFIKFEDYNNFISNLKVEDLSEENKLDIVAQRDIFKDLLLQTRDNCHKVANSEEDANKLLNEGYIELDFKTIEKFKKSYPEQYETLINLVNSKSEELKEACIGNIKANDNIPFDELKEEIKKVKITDLNDTARREISAKRPLTTNIFSNILAAALTKLREKYPSIREEYNMGKNFKAIYPEEFEELRLIAQERMPSLYEEYFEYQKQKFANMLKK